MNVFITGGTGFVGREILWQLHEAGHRIRLLSRRGPAEDVRQLAYRHRAEIVTGGLESAETLAGLMQGCEAVIHLVGIIAEHGRNTFQRVHVGTTQSVLSAAARAGVKRYLHMSALGSRAGARSRYHQTKWQAEELVRNSGLAWTIFRPSVIYGREDGFVNLLAKICRRSPFIPVFGTGNNQLQPIAVEEVARAFVGALACARAIGRTYDLCGRELFTMNALYDTLLRVMRRRRPKLHLSLPLARLQAGLMEAAGSIVGRPSPLTRDQLLMLEEDNVGDPTAAEADFHLVSRPFAEGVARYVR